MGIRAPRGHRPFRFLSASPRIRAVAAAALIAASAPSHAIEVDWADWTSSTATQAFGTVGAVGSGAPVSVTFSSPAGFGFVQTGTGTNFWTEPNAASRPYTGGVVDNAPTASELIALNGAGVKTLSFSAPVNGLYMAIMSWNDNAATFDRPFVLLSAGEGYWGTGTVSASSGNSFAGTGEPHGILYFPGTFSTLTLTDQAGEYWHGLTVGLGDVPPVPEPAAALLWMMGLTGLAGLGRWRGWPRQRASA